MRFVLKLAEKGLLPDFILRAGIRHLSKVRLKEITSNNCELGAINETAFISAMNKSEVAPVPVTTTIFTVNTQTVVKKLLGYFVMLGIGKLWHRCDF